MATEFTATDWVLMILCICIPPIVVLIKTGCSLNFVINCLLCVFGIWIGGVIHGIYVVVTHPGTRTEV